MRNPIASEETGEKEIIDTLLGIIAKEEEANRLPAPPNFGFAEIPSKHRTETNWYSPRTPRGGDVSKQEERRGSNFNNQSPHISSPVPPEQATPRPYILNPYHKSNRQKSLGNLRFKTGIPEVDFKDQLPTTWNAEKAMVDLDFRNHHRNGNGTQYSMPQSKKAPTPRNGHKNRSGHQEETNSPIPRSQGFQRQDYEQKFDKAYGTRGFNEPKYPRSKWTRTPEKSTYDSSQQHPSPRSL